MWDDSQLDRRIAEALSAGGLNQGGRTHAKLQRLVYDLRDAAATELERLRTENDMLRSGRWTPVTKFEHECTHRGEWRRIEYHLSTNEIELSGTDQLVKKPALLFFVLPEGYTLCKLEE